MMVVVCFCAGHDGCIGMRGIRCDAFARGQRWDRGTDNEMLSHGMPSRGMMDSQRAAICNRQAEMNMDAAV